MSDKQYFIGLCIDVGTYYFIQLEFIKFNFDSMLMYMSAMYCVCMYTFHSTHICMVFNSVNCVHYFYHQVYSWIITYFVTLIKLQPILCIVH